MSSPAIAHGPDDKQRSSLLTTLTCTLVDSAYLLLAYELSTDLELEMSSVRTHEASSFAPPRLELPKHLQHHRMTLLILTNTVKTDSRSKVVPVSHDFKISKL